MARLELDRLWVTGTHESTPRIKWAAQTPDHFGVGWILCPLANRFNRIVETREADSGHHR